MNTSKPHRTQRTMRLFSLRIELSVFSDMSDLEENRMVDLVVMGSIDRAGERKLYRIANGHYIHQQGASNAKIGRRHTKYHAIGRGFTENAVIDQQIILANLNQRACHSFIIGLVESRFGIGCGIGDEFRCRFFPDVKGIAIKHEIG